MKTAVENCCHCECDTPVRERDPSTLRPGDVAVTARHLTRSGATAVAPAPAAPGTPPPFGVGSADLTASLALQAAMLFLLAGRGGNPRAKPGLVHDRTFASFVNGVQPEAPQRQPAFEEMIMRTSVAVPRRRVTAYAATRFAEPARLAVEAA